MIKKTIEETVLNARGGKGEVIFRHILSKEELMGHGALYAQVTIKPHSSIGYHQHVGNTEPYYIISGKGTFIDNAGSRRDVVPGDVCLIKVGESHGMENNTDEDLVMIALVLNESN